MSFRKFFDRLKAKKRSDELIETCTFGTVLREKAVIVHRSFWPKTPCGREDDDHEAGFIHGYSSREDEVLLLKNKVEALEVLTQDIEGK